MRSLSWLKEHKIEALIGLISAALPAYLVRFRIGPIPMTGLEVVELAAIAFLSIDIFRRHSRERGNPILNGRPVGLGPRPVSRYGACFSRMDRGNDRILLIGSILIFIATIIGIAVAPDKRAALGIAKAYFWEPMILAWLLIAAKPDKEKVFRAGLIGFAVSAGLVIVYGLVQFAHPSLIPATWTAERRITSVFDYPNAVALFLAPLSSLFLAAPFGAILTGACFLTVILAKSAGGLVAAAAALLFLGILKKRTRTMTMVIGAIVALVVLFAPQAQGLREQVLMQDWSGRVHRIGWSESWAMLKEHPLWGAGLSGYPTAVAPYHTAQGVEIFQYPHNLFLAAWSEIGLIGLIGLILVLVWFFRTALRRNGSWSMVHGPFLAAAMLAILVHGLVDVPYFKNDLAMMFWLFIVLVAL